MWLPAIRTDCPSARVPVSTLTSVTFVRSVSDMARSGAAKAAQAMTVAQRCFIFLPPDRKWSWSDQSLGYSTGCPASSARRFRSVEDDYTSGWCPARPAIHRAVGQCPARAPGCRTVCKHPSRNKVRHRGPLHTNRACVMRLPVEAARPRSGLSRGRTSHRGAPREGPARVPRSDSSPKAVLRAKRRCSTANG